MTTSRFTAKGKDGRTANGRKKGSVNKSVVEFRQTVQSLLESNADNIGKWLGQVADGVPAEFDGERNMIRPAIVGDPFKALHVVAALAEYAAPKLARTEVSGPGGASLAPPVLQVVLTPPETQ